MTPPPEGRAEYARLERALADQVDRAATHAFSTVFLLAGVLALLAVVPIALGGGGAPRTRELAALGMAVVAAAGLAGTYLARGGSSYEPLAVADPCRPRSADRQGDQLQQIGLSALDGAACQLRVPREELALALADSKARAAFAREHRISDESLERAVRAGLDRTIAEAQRSGTISSLEAALVRRAEGAVPVSTIIDALQTSSGKSVLGFLENLLKG